MIYIDDNEPNIVLNDEDSSPKKEEKSAPIPGIKNNVGSSKTNNQSNSKKDKPTSGKPDKKQISGDEVPSKFKDFWYLMGITIDNNFNSVKKKLFNYGYSVKNKEQAVNAVSDIWISDDFIDFFEDISPEFEAAVAGKESKVLEEYEKSKDKKAAEKMNKSVEELSYTDEDESPFIGALIASIGAAVGATGSIISSTQQRKMEKERARAEMRKGILDIAKQDPPQKQVNWMMIITVLLFIALIVVGVILYKKYKK